MAAVSFSQLLNGERAVVTLFIVIVLFSLPLSLLLHGVALSLLAIFALSVEVRVETSTSLSQFKTRAGASSGILLGAVTLPTFMLSKLIQQSRAFSLHQVHHGELNYLALQYWAAFGSCFTVLMVRSKASLQQQQGTSWMRGRLWDALDFTDTWRSFLYLARRANSLPLAATAIIPLLYFCLWSNLWYHLPLFLDDHWASYPASLAQVEILGPELTTTSNLFEAQSLSTAAGRSILDGCHDLRLHSPCGFFPPSKDVVKRQQEESYYASEWEED
ncbi:hypothetical protein NC653_022383 [Populus alba x Populus x berolinensis]|uniref:Uncharacterized protein n=1 Tax=Populus alba x Populus x berolinensis TaxID=444605 RepID=A0AAD6QAT4_9ROSI|nr:hypothetical protein NC653_022383 [Populus alba x Populus x berolinensis]